MSAQPSRTPDPIRLEPEDDGRYQAVRSFGGRFDVAHGGQVWAMGRDDHPGPAAAAAAAEGGPVRRVLIVEDNRDAADSLYALLSLLGHDVRVAYTGPDGVRAAREAPPDVVVCDIGLPGLDGYGVAAALRDDPATAAAKLIAVTGYGQDEDRRRALAAGFDHHLTKPAPPEALLALIGPA